LHLGPDELLVGAKVEFNSELSLPQVAQAIDEAEQRVRAKVPSAQVIYLEPDCYRAGTPVDPASAPDP
jgi:divalent metal cation (Fe/Co/Zn/Cd) transporter